MKKLLAIAIVALFLAPTFNAVAAEKAPAFKKAPVVKSDDQARHKIHPQMDRQNHEPPYVRWLKWRMHHAR